MTITEQERQRFQLVYELGECAHHLIRKGVLSEPDLNRLSRQVTEVNKEINASLGQRVPRKEDGKCPQCGVECGDANFCGSCGQNISEFFSEPIASCTTCGFRVDKNDVFCGVCGTRREE